MDPTTNPSDPKPKPKAEPENAYVSSSSGASYSRHPNTVTITVTKFPSKEKTTKPVPTYQTKAYRAVEAKLAEVKKTYDALDEKQSEDWEWLTYLQKQADDLDREQTKMRSLMRGLFTSSSSSSSGSLESTMDSTTKPSGPSKMKLDPEGDAKVSALTDVLSSADLAHCLNKLALKPRLEEEEKPAKRVPVYDRKAYGRLEDELAKVKLNYRTLSKEHSKDLKELNKLSELKRELSQELESLYKKSLV